MSARKRVKRTKRKSEQGYIVRTTTFEALKREQTQRTGKTYQRKTGKRSYEVTTYRKFTKIVTRIHITDTKEKAQARVKLMYQYFEKTKRHDFGGSIQRYDGWIKTVRQGKVHIHGAVTKSSHLYSIKRKGKKKNREAELFNKMLDVMDTLDAYTFEHYR